MIDVEAELRTVLADKVEAVGLHPEAGMPPSIRRRARRRQAGTVILTGLIVAILATGATVTWTRIVPGPPPIVPIERPDDAVGSEERTGIASGTDGEVRWQVTASRPSLQGVWCLEVETMGEETRWASTTCSPSAGRRDVDNVTAGAGKPYVYAGTISDAVATVTFDAVRGREGTARIVDVRSDTDPPFRVFVAVVGKPGVVIFTARDAEGNILAQRGSAPART